MANKEHLAIINQGIEVWNNWRIKNLEIRPDLINAKLIGANLIGANLIGANLGRVNLKDAKLIDANLRGAEFMGADLRGAKFMNADLMSANFMGADLRGADLRGANLSTADFSDAKLIDANLSDADLSDAKLIDANLSRADIRSANLIGADLSDADLSGANLRGADLSDANLRSADLKGANLRDVNLNDSNLISAKLMGAELVSANLKGVDFIGVDLKGANLRSADLKGANLRSADLKGANLIDANLKGANLKSANLRSANLRSANLSGASLNDANLNGAKIGWTILGNNDLTVVKGLDSIVHIAPSTIGTDTLYKSKGQIPETFLRKCGLSDWEIESAKLYNPDLSNEEIHNIHSQIHDLRVNRALRIRPLFLSYSHRDKSFVDVLAKRLTGAGVRFWRDIRDAKAGSLEKQIDEAIHLNDVVLIVLSEHSIKSNWMEYEAQKAREKEKKMGKDALCPVALDDRWKDYDWPGWLRVQIEKYNILDFSNWQDDGHLQNTFGKLLEGLNRFYT